MDFSADFQKNPECPEHALINRQHDCQVTKMVSKVARWSPSPNMIPNWLYGKDFAKGRIVTYRDCGLPFREIGSRVGRKQTTVMRICDCWMQEGTMDRRGRSHPPQCTRSREDRQIVLMKVIAQSPHEP
ncbi:transposable element Tcb1 transposase [Trichonephila clavipes]|nr:transposable element Tcb1 transposase [Trichonephila clavipes]